MLDKEFVRERRKALGLSQEQAAEKAGLHPVQWNRIERGTQERVWSDKLVGIAKALRCTVDKLLVKD